MVVDVDMGRVLELRRRQVLVPAWLRACAFNPSHQFRVAESVVPTPRYCGPACTAAAARRELRRGRLA